MSSPRGGHAFLAIGGLVLLLGFIAGGGLRGDGSSASANSTGSIDPPSNGTTVATGGAERGEVVDAVSDLPGVTGSAAGLEIGDTTPSVAAFEFPDSVRSVADSQPDDGHQGAVLASMPVIATQEESPASAESGGAASGAFATMTSGSGGGAFGGVGAFGDLPGTGGSGGVSTPPGGAGPRALTPLAGPAGGLPGGDPLSDPDVLPLPEVATGEPATLALVGSALVGLGRYVRRRRSGG